MGAKREDSRDEKWRGALNVPTLQAFVTARTPEDVESLCEVCTATRDLRPSERQEACIAHGCGLRAPGNFLHECDWLCKQLSIFAIPELATPEQIDAFNAHLRKDRTVAAGLARYPSGEMGIGFQTQTMRARMHAALIGDIASRAGDKMHGNVRDYSAEQAKRFVSQSRRDDNELERIKVQRLYDQGSTEWSIAKKLKISRDQVRDHLGRL